MILARYFDLSIDRRDQLSRELSPCWTPRCYAVDRFLANDTSGTTAFPAVVYVDWMFWKLRIKVNTLNLAALKNQ